MSRQFGGVIPKPPSLAGRAKRSRRQSDGGSLPVIAEMNLVLIVTSKGVRRWPISKTVVHTITCM